MNLDFINNVIAFIMSIFTALIGGAGANLSSMSSTNEQVQTRTVQNEQPKPTPRPTSNQMTPDADGCVKSDPNYMKCKQDSSKIGKKNPKLSYNDIVTARNKQFNDLVAWRKNDRHLRGIVMDENLNRSAQAFAEVLAKTPGNEIWHSNYSGGRENAAMSSYSYTDFITMFSNSPQHASAMRTNGNPTRVGIGIAQDPITGYYYCVQQYGI